MTISLSLIERLAIISCLETLCYSIENQASEKVPTLELLFKTLFSILVKSKAFYGIWNYTFRAVFADLYAFSIFVINIIFNKDILTGVIMDANKYFNYFISVNMIHTLE